MTVVHILKHGRALCGKAGDPADWEDEQLWVGFEDKANLEALAPDLCSECVQVHCEPPANRHLVTTECPGAPPDGTGRCPVCHLALPPPEDCEHRYLRGDTPDSDDHHICVACGVDTRDLPVTADPEPEPPWMNAADFVGRWLRQRGVPATGTTVTLAYHVLAAMVRDAVRSQASSRPPKPSEPDVGRCDWGDCDDPSVDSRWSVRAPAGWVAVCQKHREPTAAEIVAMDAAVTRAVIGPEDPTAPDLPQPEHNYWSRCAIRGVPVPVPQCNCDPCIRACREAARG